MNVFDGVGADAGDASGAGLRVTILVCSSKCSYGLRAFVLDSSLLLYILDAMVFDTLFLCSITLSVVSR